MGRLIRGVTTAILVVLTLACRERAQTVQSEAELKDMVHRMMPGVAEAARMPFKREPVVLRRSREQVHDYVIHKIDEDLPPAELNGSQAALRLFGLIPESMELRATLINLLTEQIAGFYDPDSSALFIAADVRPQQLRTVISHELVHALQDQYARLDSMIAQRHQNDRRTAAQAVLEGQATLVQLFVLIPEQNPDTLPLGLFWSSRSVLGGLQQGEMQHFNEAPLWMRETILFPYLGGADFMVWYRHKYVGRSVLDSMPTSTEQILHPDRYALHDQPTDLTFVRGNGDTVQYEDNLGEFETRVLLQQDLGNESEATRLATGWDGDRYAVLGSQSEALVWYSVWDDTTAAGRFAEGLQRAWAKRRPDGRTARPERSEGARRSEIKQLTIEGRPIVRLVDAPADWTGWRAIPTVRLSGGRE
ncbi:MAG TPA: hypothetical protein VGQ29_10190 [Gemmatimonadales bacterium]|nr:hypothetical protein [Gemmatimonadales bacterium]